MKAAKFHAVEYDAGNKIVFLQDDADFFKAKPIAEDADNVVDYCRKLYSEKVRIMFRSKDQTWWEIVFECEYYWSRPVVTKIEKWHGHMWDKLRGNNVWHE